MMQIAKRTYSASVIIMQLTFSFLNNFHHLFRRSNNFFLLWADIYTALKIKNTILVIGGLSTS